MQKKSGNQIGADFMLAGGISSSVHQMDSLKTVSYQTTLTLSDLESSEIVWSNKFEIKKRFKRSGAGW
jgi:PBP1b-binding outer membrane lipoprotein LpoB